MDYIMGQPRQTPLVRAAHRRCRARCRGALLCAGLLAGILMVPSAQAELVGCRSDPVVILSNGVTVDLTTTINDTESDVQQVAYTLHAPVGTRILAVTYTSGVLGPKEILWFVADSAAGVYSSLTRVSTGTRGVTVSTETTAVPVSDLPAHGSATGQSQQALWVHLSL